MSRISAVTLRVREADESDYAKPVVRIHENNKPRGINWSDRIQISLDRRNWITCQLEPTGDIGAGKIYIGFHLRGILNRDTIGIQAAQLDVPVKFYLRKASSWETVYYIIAILVALALVLFIYC